MSEPQNTIPLSLLNKWFQGEQSKVEPLSEGLSGSAVWGVKLEDERFVLKSFASSASYEHAVWVHSLMQHAVKEGISQVPDLRKTMSGKTICEDEAGALWELMHWVPGEPRSTPTLEMAASSGAVLARIHLAIATLPGRVLTHEHSPGVLLRISKAIEVMKLSRDARLQRVQGHPEAIAMHDIISLLEASVTQKALKKIAHWNSRVVAIQPVLRDIWYEHIFFEGEQVSGIVDWHASGVDTPATDIARLFGSWPDDHSLEMSFLESYQSIRRLTDEEQRLIPFLKASGVILGLENWFRWIVEENRYFADKQKAINRINSLQQAFPRAAQVLIDWKFDQ